MVRFPIVERVLRVRLGGVSPSSVTRLRFPAAEDEAVLALGFVAALDERCFPEAGATLALVPGGFAPPLFASLLLCAVAVFRDARRFGGIEVESSWSSLDRFLGDTWV